MEEGWTIPVQWEWFELSVDCQRRALLRPYIAKTWKERETGGRVTVRDTSWPHVWCDVVLAN